MLQTPAASSKLKLFDPLQRGDRPTTACSIRLCKLQWSTPTDTLVKTMRKFDGAYLPRFIVPTNYPPTICRRSIRLKRGAFKQS